MYASSRMITRLYKPLLEKFDLTYPQYLVLMVLWHEEKLSISELGQKLYLGTNTLTPLIKKMNEKKLIRKKRSREDERTVYVQLTEKGKKIEEMVELLFHRHLESLEAVGNVTYGDLDTLNTSLRRLERFWLDQVRYRL